MVAYEYRRALDVATSAAAQAAALLLAECRRETGPRGSIGHCPADDEAELLIRAQLLAAFPAYGYRGEETDFQQAQAGELHLWLVDPNDGTASMQRGFRGHAVSIALLRDGIPVLGVVHAVDAPDDEGDRFAWAEGCGPLTRNGVPIERAPWPGRLGPHDVVLVSQSADRHPGGNLRGTNPARFISVASIAYRLALVAAGDGVAGVSLAGTRGWDYGGGHALLRAVGGVLIDESGAEVTYDSTGRSQAGWCFGGGAAVVDELRRRDWTTAPHSGFGEAAPPADLRPARLAAGALFHDSGVLRRAHGCLLGQVAGDALGALVEFQPAASIGRQYPDGGPDLLADGGPHRIMAGQPTDDSELALILARTLVNDERFDPESVATGYARWYHGWTHDLAVCSHRNCRPFDVGGTTAQALGAISLDDVHSGTAARSAQRAASTGSQANGALMRVSPLGIWGWNRDLGELAESARADARLTHPHPVCQDASAVFVVAIAQAVREGLDPRQTYDRALTWARTSGAQPEIVGALERAATSPPADYQHQQGWVLIALQNAFYRLLQSPSLEDAVVDTVRAGGDTDTNAAICGALLGAVHGRNAVPTQWQQMVLSCRAMPGYGHIQQPRPAVFWPTDLLILAERLLTSPDSNETVPESQSGRQTIPGSSGSVARIDDEQTAASEGERLVGRYPLPSVQWPDPTPRGADSERVRNLFRGCLLWGAVGDALGRSVETLSPTTVRARYGPDGPTHYERWRGWRSGPTGTITDDTQLTMETARSLIATGGAFDPEDFSRRLVAWLPVGRGKGQATTQAVENLIDGQPWWRAGVAVNSAGNGSAMRAGPVGLVHAFRPTPERLMRDAVLSSVPTHTHHVAVACAIVIAAGVAWCVRASLQGARDFDRGAFIAFVASTIDGLEQGPTRERRPGGGAVRLVERVREIETLLSWDSPERVFAYTYNGAFALESVPAALYCFLRAPNNPREVILSAVRAGHDADTVASMAGNLVGAWIGADRLREAAAPWWNDLEYRDDLSALADDLARLAFGE